MYGLFLLLWVLTVFLAIPVLFVMFIVNLIRKKRKWQILLSIGICFFLSIIWVFGALFTVPPDLQKEMPTTTEQVETTAKVQEPTTEKETDPPTTTGKESTTVAPTTEKETTTKPATPKVDTMVQQFVKLGFTKSEAEEMRKIFKTVGITEVHNIKPALGSGIDNLQSFTCDIYDYRADKGGVSVQFTIDKRQLCFVSLNGIPTTKTDYAYINIFGNVKFKTSNSTKSVTLYDIWDESGEIDDTAIGYKAVFDYENKKITKYEG